MLVKTIGFTLGTKKKVKNNVKINKRSGILLPEMKTAKPSRQIKIAVKINLLR